MAVGFDKFDEEKERARLCKMSDEELIREGRAARYMLFAGYKLRETTAQCLRDCATAL
jgi:hypothetical protein